jgi:hypothetical protein
MIQHTKRSGTIAWPANAKADGKPVDILWEVEDIF